jgi:hypothetical protein
LTFITDFILSVVVVVTEGALILSGEASLPFATAPKAPTYAGAPKEQVQDLSGSWIEVTRNGFKIEPQYIVDGNTFDVTDFKFIANQWRIQDDLDDPTYEFGRYKCAMSADLRFGTPDASSLVAFQNKRETE